MRKFLLACLFIVAIGFALFNFKGLASQGEFQSIVLDFREDIPAAQIDSEIKAISQKYGVTPRLNSEFSQTDNIYILEGNKQILDKLRKSQLSKETEYIEPNYLYSAFYTPNDPDYGKQKLHGMKPKAEA